MGLFKTDKSKSSPPPPPPPPPPPASQRRNQKTTAQPVAQRYPAGSFAIGVETEFLIAARDSKHAAKTIEQFCRLLAESYKQSLSALPKVTHPGMHNAINEAFIGERYSEWSLDKDSTIETPNSNQQPWPVEVISPILRVHAGSGWRSHIGALWDHLDRNYLISANDSCSTHVHISVVGGYTLQNLQMIACSILHFEPAFEALLPRARRGNEYTKSNWIDNKCLGYKNITREASMDLVMKCSSERSLILLMNPDNEGDRDKMFGWNFLNLLQSLTSTIEFRRGAPSSSVDDVFMWIEIAASFLQASMKLGTRENLRRTPGTVGGLSYFINAAQLPTSIFQPQYLARFFNTAPNDASAQPLPVGKLSKEKAKKLEKKKLEDKQRNIMLTKTLNAPYWD